MRLLVLRTATRYLLVLLALYSVFTLVRGHNEPGGGFIGGLLLASGFAVYGIAHGVEPARRALRIDPGWLAGLGLLIALLSGCAALLVGGDFMTTQWLTGPIPGIGKVSTVLIFDVGVYLVVTGTVLHILFSLGEE
jgi:multicomponent Na+:H+ antiporter subunit B